TSLAKPFVKFAAQVERLKDLPTLVHRAAKTALAPPTGPVFLSLPGDILKNDGDIDLLQPTRVAPRVRGDLDAVHAAADLLAKAERPVIIAGDAVAQSRGHKELAALAELIGAPVYTEFVPNTASFPSSHPLYRGSMTRSQQGVREVLDRHDLLFSVGGDMFTWSLPSKIEPMPPKDAVVIEEVLSSAPGARSLINSDDEQSFFALRGGGIGWGLPAAIGAKLALPDRPVVALVGDGSAMYTVQALWTAAHYKLPVIWAISTTPTHPPPHHPP